jgi:hypothetical protein
MWLVSLLVLAWITKINSNKWQIRPCSLQPPMSPPLDQHRVTQIEVSIVCTKGFVSTWYVPIYKGTYQVETNPSVQTMEMHHVILHPLWEQLAFLERLCIQAWEGLQNIIILGHPNLRTFSLSGQWVRCLSLCGCSKLKSVKINDDLIALEEVDLSRTAIGEVPHNLPNLPQLNKLLLLGVPCSMRFPWHQLVRFPMFFYLDHHVDDENQLFKMFCHNKLCADGNCHQVKRTNDTAQININDSRMFHSFNEDAAKNLVNQGQFLGSFSVHVKQCSVRSMEPRNNEIEQCASRIQKHSMYRDVQFNEAANILPLFKLSAKTTSHWDINIESVPKWLKAYSLCDQLNIYYRWKFRRMPYWSQL